jgi:hypothetical protein
MQINKRLLILIFALCLTATATAAIAGPVVKAKGRAPAPASNKGAAVQSNTKGTAANTAYLTRLRGKLLNNWDVPNGKNRVTLTTVVNADGSIGDVVLNSTPKNADAEISGSESFAKSQPLEALPAGGQAKLILTFESSADPHGDSSSNVYTQIVPVPAVKVAAPADAAPATTPATAPADAAPAK